MSSGIPAPSSWYEGVGGTKTRSQAEKWGSVKPSSVAVGVALALLLSILISQWSTSAESAHGDVRVLAPNLILADGQFSVATSVTVEHEEALRAWFMLSPTDQEEPWRTAVYRSINLDQRVLPREVAVFHWLETVDVPDGTYDLTIWIHRRVGNSWQHAAGGLLGLPPVVVERGSANFVGPFRLAVTSELPSFTAGWTTTLDLAVGVYGGGAECRTQWQLLVKGGGRPVASGESGPCDRPEIAVPATLQPGDYTLAITATAVRGEQRLDSDRLTLPVVIRG